MTAIESDLKRAACDSVADRLFQAVVASLEVQAAYLGDRLGWYRALAAGGAMTAGALAAATGTHAQATREWLEHQAASGYLAVADPGADSTDLHYVLPAANRPVLDDEHSAAYLIPFARMAATFAKSLDDVVAGYRTGAVRSARMETT
jgi:hypothetical protein